MIVHSLFDFYVFIDNIFSSNISNLDEIHTLFVILNVPINVLVLLFNLIYQY